MAGFVVQRPQQQGYREGEGLGAAGDMRGCKLKPVLIDRDDDALRGPAVQAWWTVRQASRGLAMIKSTKAFLLAGASALAILASAAEANAETFAFTGAVQSFTVSVSGE
jgi:hypothetical protein